MSQTKCHYSFLLLTNIHTFNEKGPKCAKIDRKPSVQLTVQISDGLKNKIGVKNLMSFEKIMNLTNLTILSKIKWINGVTFTIYVATSTSSFSSYIFLFHPLILKIVKS